MVRCRTVGRCNAIVRSPTHAIEIIDFCERSTLPEVDCFLLCSGYSIAFSRQASVEQVRVSRSRARLVMVWARASKRRDHIPAP